MRMKDNPVTNRPAFSIHPCRTAAVLEASLIAPDVTALEYLILWVGAMGKCVGLDMPVILVQNKAS